MRLECWRGGQRVTTVRFMSELNIKVSDDLDVLIYDSNLEIVDDVLGSVEVYSDEIDDLIAALQKAKAMMSWR